MGVKFANPSLELGLRNQDPLERKIFQALAGATTRKQGNKIKGKQKKLGQTEWK